MLASLRRQHLLALLLYSVVLFGSFGCALHHAQDSGLVLAGLEHAACGDGSLPPTPLDDLQSTFGCALCGHAQAAPVHLNGWSLHLPPAPAHGGLAAPPTADRYSPPPHQRASPRAPPRLQA